jgi:transposase
MEDPSIRETIETYGTSAIANAMGLGVSTVHGWKVADAIPSERGLYELRVKAFWAAVRKLKPKKKRAA